MTSGQLAGGFIVALLISCANPSIEDPQAARRALADSAADAGLRVVAYRLSGFPHVPGVSPRDGDPDLRAVHDLAAAVVAHHDAANDPNSKHAAAIAALINGDIDGGLRRIETAAAQSPANASVWNDLAVVRAVAADARKTPALLCAALAAIDTSLRIRETPEAVSNRATLLAKLGLKAAAAEAAQRSLRIEQQPEWASETRRIIDPQVSRQNRWEEMTPRVTSGAAIDPTRIRMAVHTHPQEARSWTEAVYLTDWANAVRSDHPLDAEASLRFARIIAEELRDFRGEHLALAAVTAIETAAPSDRMQLADAHREYFDARKHYEARDVAGAKRLFEQAAVKFEKSRSPVSLVVQYYIASCTYDSGRGDDALIMLRNLLKRTPVSYRALRAQIFWEIGSVHSRAGMLLEALSAQRAALALFTELGERGNASIMRTATAASEAALGRHDAAWRTRVSAFRDMSDLGDTAALQRALDVAARTEILAERWDTAHSLLVLACEPALRRNPRIYASSAMWRALAAQRLGLTDATGALAEARNAANALLDASLKRRASAAVAFAEAMLTRQVRPRAAQRMLTRFIESAASDRDLFLLPEALLERALIARTLPDEGEALSDLVRAQRLIEQRRRSMPRDEIRDAYFRTSERVLRELVDLHTRDGRPEEALAAVDRHASAPYNVTVLPIRNARASLDVGSMLVSYVSLEHELVILTLSRHGTGSYRVPVTKKQLSKEVDLLLDRVLTQTSPTAEPLIGWLLGPISDDLRSANDLLVIPDETLARVPFSMLVGTNQTVTISPSVSVVLTRRSGSAKHTEVVVVGDPAFDTSQFEGLPRLPYAAREAAAVARRYPGASLLTGSEATRDAVLRAIEHASVLHLATHAVALPHDPMRSSIVLAPAPGSGGALYLQDILGRSLHLDIVVLAGCRTAVPADSRRNVETLALGFVAAGSNNVVATLWDVEDRITAHFSTHFHERLLSGRSPTAAVHDVQALMRTSPVAAYRHPRAWAAFQIYGSRQRNLSERSIQ